MSFNKCEMCLVKKRGVHEGQCLRCHVEICDMPLRECIGKQVTYKRMSSWDRFLWFGEEMKQ